MAEGIQWCPGTMCLRCGLRSPVVLSLLSGQLARGPRNDTRAAEEASGGQEAAALPPKPVGLLETPWGAGSRVKSQEWGGGAGSSIS